MIAIDTREDYLTQFNRFLQFGFEDVMVEKLDLGDYLVDNKNRMLVERKTITDFCSTMDVLSTRLMKMRSEFEYTALVVEGVYKITDTTLLTLRGNTWVETLLLSSFNNFLTKQQLAGTVVRFTNSLSETILWLIDLHSYLPKLEEPVIRRGLKPVDVLGMLPGIGKKRAEEIYRRSGASLIRALARLDEWKQIQGIGDKTIEKVKKFLGYEGFDMFTMDSGSKGEEDYDKLMNEIEKLMVEDEEDEEE